MSFQTASQLELRKKEKAEVLQSSSQHQKKFVCIGGTKSMVGKSKLAQIRDKLGEAYAFHCPACQMMHVIPVKYEEEYQSKTNPKPIWAFNGNFEKPSFKPNFKVVWKGTDPLQTCHCIIRDGELIYLIDSTHAMSGSRIKMQDME